MACQNLPIIHREPIFICHDAANLCIDRLSVKASDGTQFVTHGVSTAKGATGAVCIVEQHGKLLLGKHFRPALNACLWEFPRGMGQAAETPVQTALRELGEETGITTSATNAHQLSTIYADSGLLSNPIAVVLVNAPDATTGANLSAAADNEFLALKWVEPQYIDVAIAKGEISDGITLAAYSVWTSYASILDI